MQQTNTLPQQKPNQTTVQQQPVPATVQQQPVQPVDTEKKSRWWIWLILILIIIGIGVTAYFLWPFA